MSRLLDRIFGRSAPSPVPDRLVIGLGNPGTRYAETRHNVGFRVAEGLAERWGVAFREDRGLAARVAIAERPTGVVAVLAPTTFMNRSGDSVERALERWPALDASQHLLVVYDDLDLPTGRIRLRPGGGGGGHNGIGDILERLARKDVPRLRFGIGHPGEAGAVRDWVLGPFSEQDEALLPGAVDRAIEAVEAVLDGEFTAAMGRFNAAG